MLSMAVQEPPRRPKGMLRAALGVERGTLASAFDRLGTLPHAQSVDLPGTLGGSLHLAEIPLDPDDGFGVWRLMSLGGAVQMVVTDCVFNSDRLGRVAAEDMLELHFVLEGPPGLSLRGTAAGPQSVEMSMVACNPTAGFSYDITCPSGAFRTLGVYVRPEFVRRSCGLGQQPGSLLWRLLHPQPGTIEVLEQPLSVDVRRLVEQVIALRPDRPASALRLAGLMLALSVQSFALLDETPEVSGQSRALRERDIALLGAARGVLESDLRGEVRISRLARQLGTNATKLKSGFRLFYGCSMGAFRNQVRMEHALRMLTEQGSSVAEVAYAVGFRHQASLTTAFRAHFGITPREARNRAARGPRTN